MLYFMAYSSIEKYECNSWYENCCTIFL